LCSILRCYFRICLEELKKSTKNNRHDIRSSVSDLKLRPDAFESAMATKIHTTKIVGLREIIVFISFSVNTALISADGIALLSENNEISL
jgi:hypothetical protein